MKGSRDKTLGGDPVRIAFLAFLLHSAAAVAAPALDGAIPQKIDERYRLDIGQRRYSQPAFSAGQSLEIGDPRRLHCRAGVFLTTGPINVLLEGVHGDVRFLADPSRLQRLFRSTPPNP